MTFRFINESCYLISLESREDRRVLFIENTDSQGFELNTFEWVQAIEDSDFGEYDTATEYDLESFHLGAQPLAVADPDGVIQAC